MNMKQIHDDYRLGLYEKAMPDYDSWEQKLDITRDCGFDWLELSVDETDKKLSRLYWNAFELQSLRSAIGNTGVPVHSMCLSGHRRFPLGSHDDEIRNKSIEIMKRAVDFAAETGIRIIQLAGYDVYYEESDDSTVSRFKDGLRKSVDFAADCGVVLGFETMETPFLDTVRKGMCFVHEIDSPYLGMYPDIGNLKNAAVIYGTDVVDDLNAGKGHIFAAHLKETAPGIYRDMHFGTTGHTEYKRCVKELWKQGVRMYTGEFWYHGEENYREEIISAADFLRGKIRDAIQEL